jgi:hypothetical protein
MKSIWRGSPRPGVQKKNNLPAWVMLEQLLRKHCHRQKQSKSDKCIVERKSGWQIVMLDKGDLTLK